MLKNLVLVLTLVIISSALVNITLAGNLKPNCSPERPPTQGGCGISAFVDLIRRFITGALIIIIPLTVIFITWGGFVIMTAGGSSERVEKGKEMIKIAVTGLLIALGAWLLLTSISKFFFAEQFQLR